MKKIGILLSTAVLSVFHQNSLAQDPSIQISPFLNNSALKNGGEIPGYFSSPPGVDLLRNAIKNPDGSRTIKAGRQTPEANELNRKYCESMGAKDVTNDADITISASALYGVVCAGSENLNLESSVGVLPGIGTGRIFLPIQEKKLRSKPVPAPSSGAAMQIVPSAINGSTPFGQLYYVNGVA